MIDSIHSVRSCGVDVPADRPFSTPPDAVCGRLILDQEFAIIATAEPSEPQSNVPFRREPPFFVENYEFQERSSNASISFFTSFGVLSR